MSTSTCASSRGPATPQGPFLTIVSRNLKPGGWVELQDVDGAVHCDDGTLPPDWPVLVFCNLMVEAFSKLGTTSHAAMFGGKYLEEAGFVNIRHHTAKLPYGTWPKDKFVPLRVPCLVGQQQDATSMSRCAPCAVMSCSRPTRQ